MRRDLFAGMVAALALALVSASCESTAPELPRLRFRVTDDIGPCSSELRIQFTLDGALLGEETFRIGLGPDRRESSWFSVPAGAHVVGAHVVNRVGTTVRNGFVWPDTTMTFAAGDAHTRSIDFYCS